MPGISYYLTDDWLIINFYVLYYSFMQQFLRSDLHYFVRSDNSEVDRIFHIVLFHKKI